VWFIFRSTCHFTFHVSKYLTLNAPQSAPRPSALPKPFTTSRQKPTQRIGSARAAVSSETAATARKEILRARKHRNRLSAAAHRERKNQHISELEQLVAELSDQNRFLKEALSSNSPTVETVEGTGAERNSALSIQNVISPPAECA